MRVRYFASLVDLTGTSTEEVEISETARVEDLWDLLEGRHDSLRRMAYRPMVACDLEYAEYRSPLSGVREVAFLPPVSGG